MLELYNFIENS